MIDLRTIDNKSFLQTSENMDDYNVKLDYLIEDAKNDFYLTIGNDTIKSNYYHFERTYELTTYDRVNIGFDKKNEVTDDIYFHSEDNEFKTGHVILNIPFKSINRLPNLKM